MVASLIIWTVFDGVALGVVKDGADGPALGLDEDDTTGADLGVVKATPMVQYFFLDGGDADGPVLRLDGGDAGGAALGLAKGDADGPVLGFKDGFVYVFVTGSDGCSDCCYDGCRSCLLSVFALVLRNGRGGAGTAMLKGDVELFCCVRLLRDEGKTATMVEREKEEKRTAAAVRAQVSLGDAVMLGKRKEQGSDDGDDDDDEGVRLRAGLIVSRYIFCHMF
jgi:hypothetical protein